MELSSLKHEGRGIKIRCLHEKIQPCGKMVLLMFKLSLHKIRVHRKSSVSCDSCETVVKSKSNLKIRGRKVHGIQNVRCRLCVTIGAMEVWSKSEISEEIKEFQLIKGASCYQSFYEGLH